MDPYRVYTNYIKQKDNLNMYNVFGQRLRYIQ